MGTQAPFRQEKLVIGILAAAGEDGGALIAELSRSFGPADYKSPWMPFDFSPYYDPEMGGGIRRAFVSFSRLVDPSSLAAIKTATNALENGRRVEGRRRVNLDPGLLCLSRFVLASTKESSHRIALADGIYAEITLVFEHGTFRPVEWTYPDYRSPGYISILNEIRGLFRARLRRSGAPEAETLRESL